MKQVLKFLRPPKSFDTPGISLTEKKILQAQEVSFIEISVDQYQVCELEENANCIVDDVQNVYAAQVFDAFTVKVPFISQEISKIEHIQSQHQASELQLVVPTSVKTIAFSKPKSISWHAGSLVITDGQKNEVTRTIDAYLFLYHYDKIPAKIWSSHLSENTHVILCSLFFLPRKDFGQSQ